jgi:hypothetical protein
MLLIPRVFHQIWVGPDPLPEEFAAYQKTWLRHNAGWALRLWTEDNLPADLERREVYEKLRVPAERADILRLEVLWRFGGIYIDTDFECLRPVEPLLDGIDFFVADSKPGRINNAIIGAVPRHPILRHGLRDLKPRVYHGYDKAAAGPAFVDLLVRQYPEVKIFEPAVFYPATPAERGEAVAVHHMARSWKDSDGFKRAAMLAERRLVAVQTQLLEVMAELEDVRRLERLDEVQARLERLCSRVTYHRSVPKGKRHSRFGAFVGALRSAPRRVVRRAAHLTGGMVRKGQHATRRARSVATKKVWRGACLLYDMRNRPTYRTRLDRVANRDEVPIVLNRRGLLGSGVEIGVKVGRFSELLLTRWRGRRLISVDPWLEDSRDAYVDRANVPQSRHEEFYALTRQRLKRFADRSEIWRMTSAEAAGKVDTHSLDFVYIDARHDYASVKQDLELWFDKVRPGGIVAGHDYADGDFEQGTFGVKRAVDEFFAKRGLRVYSTRGKYPVEMFPTWIVAKPSREEGAWPAA